MSGLVLITNIDRVSFKEMWVWCHALLLEQRKPVSNRVGDAYFIHGYGMEMAWPAFGYHLNCESLEYEVESQLFSTELILRFRDGNQLVVERADTNCDLDTTMISEPAILPDLLRRQVLHYWRRPYTPSLVWNRSQP